MARESHAIKNLLDESPLNGSKTYITGIVMILVGAGAIWLEVGGHNGYLSRESAIEMIFAGIGFITFGHKIDKTL